MTKHLWELNSVLEEISTERQHKKGIPPTVEEIVRCIADLIEDFKRSYPSARLAVDTTEISVDARPEILLKVVKTLYIEVEMVVDPTASIVRMLAKALVEGKEKRLRTSTTGEKPEPEPEPEPEPPVVEPTSPPALWTMAGVKAYLERENEFSAAVLARWAAEDEADRIAARIAARQRAAYDKHVARIRRGRLL